MEEQQGRTHQVVYPGECAMRSLITMRGESGHLRRPAAKQLLPQVLSTFAARMAKVFGDGDRPWQVSHRADTSLESMRRQHLTAGQRVADEERLSGGDGDSLTVDRIERAVCVTDGDETLGPLTGGAVALPPVARLSMNVDLAGGLEQLDEVGQRGVSQRGEELVQFGWVARWTMITVADGIDEPMVVLDRKSQGTHARFGRRGYDYSGRNRQWIPNPVNPAGIAELSIDRIWVRNRQANGIQPLP